MHKAALFTALALIGNYASATTAISNLDLFEGKYIQCIENEMKDSCLESSISNHFIPGGDKSKDAQVLHNFLIKWMNGIDVYKVHKTGLLEVEGLMQKRFYLIELSDGALAILNVRYRSIRGQWHVLDIESSTNKEAIDEGLGGKMISPTILNRKSDRHP